jgi:hypothetical protein
MTDPEQLHGDPVVDEVRRIREEIFAEYNYDLVAYCEAMQRRQATSGARYATPQPGKDLSAAVDPAKKVG